MFQGVQFPTPDTSLLVQGLGVLLVALLGIWVVRKVVKLVNKS